MIIAIAAVAVALVLAAAMIPIAPSNLRAATAVTGVIAVVLTVAAVLGWPRALAWALVAFVLEYALALANRPELDSARRSLVAASWRSASLPALHAASEHRPPRNAERVLG